MAKHQRRFHRRSAHPLKMDDGDAPDPESYESPSTLQNFYAEIGQDIDGFPPQHSLLGDLQNYAEHDHQNSLIYRAPRLVPEQNNPGVATLTTPSSSSISRAIPVSQEPYYTHQAAQAATYALHNSPSSEPMVQFHKPQHQHHSSPVTQIHHVQDQYRPPADDYFNADEPPGDSQRQRQCGMHLDITVERRFKYRRANGDFSEIPWMVTIDELDRDGKYTALSKADRSQRERYYKR